VIAALRLFSPRDQALVVVMLHTGFRVSEATGMTLGDVWSAGQIRPRVSVNRARLKGGRSCRKRTVTGRSVPLNAKAAAALERYLFARFGSSGPADLAGPLFPGRHPGGRLSRWAACDLVHRVFTAAGIDSSAGTGEFGTHSLRKIFARRVFKLSGNNLLLVRDCLFHTTVSTTGKYVLIDAEEVDRVINRAGEEQVLEPQERQVELGVG